MRFIALLVVLVAVVVACVRADGAALDGVVDLTAANFESVVGGSSRGSLVMYHAAWCGHCRNAMPEVAKLGLAAKGSGVVIGRVDADAAKELCDRAGVQGYPTFKFYPAGDSAAPVDYSGDRTAAAMINFINEKAGTRLFVPREVSHVVELDASNFDAVALDENKAVLVAFTAGFCGHCKKMKPAYRAAAAAFAGEKNIVIANIEADEAQNKELSAKYGVSGFPTIKFFPRGANKDAVEYTGGRDATDFVTFINEKTGAMRTESGDLNEIAGTDAQLDAFAAEFMAASGAAARAEVATKIAARVADVSSAGLPDAVNYQRAAERVLKDGDGYIAGEKARIDRMLAGKVAADRRDALVKKRNALAKFVAA